MSRLPIPFANHRTYLGHSGIDFAQPRGTLVRASGPGIIGLRNTTARGGHTLWVDYDGYPGVAYAHLDDYRDSPPVGTRVVEGTPICRVGNSGFSTGPHLHMEVNGHATTVGFWCFFDPNRVVSAGQPSGGGGQPLPTPTTDETECDTMFIANVKNGNFWLCEPGKKAHLLGKGSGARESGIPIINYPDDWAVQQLRTSRPEIT